MKTSLSHLPEHKQQQILQVLDIIKSVVNPEKIILFGSYAKGTFVEHRYRGKDGIEYEYISDYDFLVVTKDNPEHVSDQNSTVNRLTNKIKPELNLEIHDINYINEGLEFGQYFFSDIVKEGVLLYDRGTVEFAQPKELSPAEEQVIAQRYFDIWFTKGKNLFEIVTPAVIAKDVKIAAFLLHQSTESLYYATLLVHTGYKPKIHNLYKLRKQAKVISEDLFLIFPIETDKNEEHLFDLLKRGYIDARYRSDYEISVSEAVAIVTHIASMCTIVRNLCRKKIKALGTK